MAPQALAFVEYPAQAAAGLAAANAEGREVVWLALTPGASWALEKTGVPYEDIGRYHDLEALAGLDTRNIERTEAFCRKADAWAREAVPEAGAHRLEIALACYFSFRHVFNAPTLCAALYDAVMRKHGSVPEVWHWLDARETPGEELWLKKESMWSRFLARRLAKDGRKARAFEPQPRPAQPLSTATPPARALSRTLETLASAAAALSAPRERRLAVLDEGYNLGRALALNRAQRRFSVFNLNRLIRLLEPLGRLRPGPERAQAAALWERLRGSAELAAAMPFDGLDPALVEDQLAVFFTRVVPDAVALHRAARRALAWTKPGVAAASAMGRYREKVVAQACREAGVPFAVYQHGEMGLRAMGPLSHKFWYYNDMQFSDVHLVFGEGQVRFSAEKYGDEGARVEPVGSAHLDELSRRAARTDRAAVRRELGLPEGPLFVYVLGQFASGIKIPPTYRSDAACFDVERRIVDLFGSLPGVTLVIAPKAADAPAGNPLPEFVAQRAYPNVLISSAGFPRLVLAADAFIVDRPTTTFLEALATDRPVFMTDHLLNWEWQPGVSSEFGKRVAHANGLGDFLALIQDAVARGDYAPRTDRTLISQYGTYKDDGRSAERALDALEALAARRAPARKAVPA